MNNKEEQLKQEIGALIEEYKSMRDDSLKNVEAGRQVLNFTLTSAGILVALSPFIIERNFPTLFLIIPIIFYALVWTQIRYLYLNSVLIDYSLRILAPNLRNALGELASTSKRKFDTLLSWDAYLKKMEENTNLPLSSIAAARYGIPLFLSFFSVMAYLISHYPSFPQMPNPPPWWDTVLIIVNLILLLYSMYLLYWARFIMPNSFSKNSIPGPVKK